MKKVAVRICSILIYLCVLLYFFQFKIGVLLNLKLIFMVIAGAVILSIPLYSRKMRIMDMAQLIAKNAIQASYIVTFILLFIRLSGSDGYDGLLEDIALSCRPLFYGYVLYILLQFEGNDTDVKSESSADTNAGRKELSSTQVYYRFRELGLTEREAEVANHICKGMSNGEIANELCISETTVKKHVSHIFEKMNISRREDLKNFLI